MAKNPLVVFSKTHGSFLRSLIRALTLIITGFVTKLDTTQVTTIQLAVETLLQSGTQLTTIGDLPPPGQQGPP